MRAKEKIAHVMNTRRGLLGSLTPQSYVLGMKADTVFMLLGKRLTQVEWIYGMGGELSRGPV